MQSSNTLKKRIVKVAEQKFCKIGYSKVKVDEIAFELGISKRTLYQFFLSKEEILKSVVSKYLEETQKKFEESILWLEQNQTTHFTEGLKCIWEVVIESGTKFSAEFILDLQKTVPSEHERISNFWDNFIKTNFFKVYKIGIESSHFNANLNKDILYLIHLEVTKKILNPIVYTKLGLSYKETVMHIYDALLLGILSDYGRKKYR